ncbi:MAG: hypothetical protein JWL86_1487, partial [Rhizobium sp.]|nr:hypothetical protein [Rhizobium sp.]
MSLFLRLGVPAMAVVATIGFGLMTSSSATAGEFCRTDVTGHMTSCSFTSMEQCHAASAGIGGDCFRDPNLAASGGGSSGSAYAYSPKAPHAAKGSRKGN